MNIKNYPTKLALASVALISAVGFAPSAIAENIIFNGTVTASCEFSNTVNGVLEENTAKNGLVTTTVGTTNLTCNQANSTLTVNAINPAGSNPTSTTNTPDVTIAGAGSGNITTVGGNVSTLGLGVNNITANITANVASGVIPAGQYSYTLVLTANAN